MSYGDIALEMQGAGALMQTFAAFAGAQNQKAMLRGQAEIADINAGMAERAAQAALFGGQREEQRSRLATAQLKGTQKATLAANGVDLGEGTAARLLTTTDVMGEIDANTIAANAVRSAWGYRTQAAGYKLDAVGKRAAAGAISPGLAAATTLLTGASSVAASWYGLNKSGALDRYASGDRYDSIAALLKSNRGTGD